MNEWCIKLNWRLHVLLHIDDSALAHAYLECWFRYGLSNISLQLTAISN